MNDLALYRCLGSPTRLDVLKQLRNGEEVCVTDLAVALRAEQTNLSHHLAELRACGLVVARQEGKKVCYSLAHPQLRRIMDMVEDFARHTASTDPEGCRAAGCC